MLALVTGGTGFIGSGIVRALLATGHEVRCLVRDGANVSNLSGLPIEIVTGDITNIDSLALAMRGCTQVFHAAALYSFWVSSLDLFEEVNVCGTRNVLQAALDCGVDHVVYTSSVAALAVPTSDDPVSEDMPVDPRIIIGAYKKSKYLAEQVALEFAHRGLRVVIVNPSFPVGSRDIKPTPTGQMIVDFLNHRLPAYVDTGMNVVDVDDVAQGHVLAAARGKTGERYILGGKNMSMSEILGTLSRISGIPAPRVRLPYRPLLTMSYLNAAWCRITRTTPRMTPDTIRMSAHKMYYDSGKAIRELGFPQTDPQAALQKAVTWFTENGYVK